MPIDETIPLSEFTPHSATSALDVQVGGSHYKDMVIQPAEFVHKNGLGYLDGSVVYYISRHRNKGREKDIRKIMHTCRLILKLQYGVDE